MIYTLKNSPESVATWCSNIFPEVQRIQALEIISSIEGSANWKYAYLATKWHYLHVPHFTFPFGFIGWYWFSIFISQVLLNKISAWHTHRAPGLPWSDKGYRESILCQFRLMFTKIVHAAEKKSWKVRGRKSHQETGQIQRQVFWHLWDPLSTSPSSSPSHS